MDFETTFESSTLEQRYKRAVAHMELVRDKYWDEVSRIKELIANDQHDEARCVWMDVRSIPLSDRIGLWVATTRGGVWTIAERRVLKPNVVTQ